ncbi:hypothetical protein [Meiothermus sp. Pnk-1]|uniref:hypothetical protein n=1 Tax=Meiothermus sp. Pnk-1 TaxID=873128 RepID=UPI000D7BCC49|nr:hypothetical protein [Meiothermus sp. Pnk-1]PZA08307.1 hypothetical protein DNA98_04000 [Meiothermus sp. Pnk-1]
MSEFVVQISGNPKVLENLERLTLRTEDVARLFPQQIAALERLAEEAHARFAQWASEASRGYGESIRLERLEGLEWRIFADPERYPRAAYIEQGNPAWDMKKVLRTSNKVRFGRRGRYLVIPLRRRSLSLVTPASSTEWGGVGSGASVLTFRTMSEASPPDSWIYPERPGARVAERVLSWLEEAWPQLAALAREQDARGLTQALTED